MSDAHAIATDYIARYDNPQSALLALVKDMILDKWPLIDADRISVAIRFIVGEI